jgi:hypothetical protein
MLIKNETALKAALLTNWNTDPLLTPIAEDSEMFRSYFLNSLISMCPDEIAIEWIEYFERKQEKRQRGENV